MNEPRPASAAGATAIDAGTKVIGAALPHDSAELHVAGAAAYTDDLPEPRGTLHVALGVSPLAHGRLKAVVLEEVRAAPDVVDVITAADIPGDNDVGPIQHDDPIFAEEFVQFAGQPVFAVAATSVTAARRAARLAQYDIDALPAILTIDDAMALESFVLPPVHVTRGNAAAAISAAPHRLHGTARSGGQDHFYLEGQIALAVPRERGGMHIYTSTQHPGEVQQMVARALRSNAHDVAIECRRMGGGFGGKETQMSLFACVAALIARRTGRAAKLRLDRDDDMRSTGKRHAFQYEYDVGFDDQGRILGLDLTLASRCGFSADLSGPINDRAVFHADNAYWLPDVAHAFLPLQDPHRFRHRVSRLRRAAGHVRHRNDDRRNRARARPGPARRAPCELLRRPPTRNVTPYGMTVEDNIAPELVARAREATSRLPRARQRDRLMEPCQSGDQERPRAHPGQIWHFVHGHALQPGRRAVASLQRRHAAAESSAAPKWARVSSPRCSRSWPTNRRAVSRHPRIGVGHQQGAQCVGHRGLVRQRHQWHGGANAARICASGWRPSPRASSIATRRIVESATVSCMRGPRRCPSPTCADGVLRTRATFRDRLLSPRPRSTTTGRPCPGARSSTLPMAQPCRKWRSTRSTGEHRLLAVDILHDVGASLNPAIDRGQIEGGFMQGWAGWPMEELWWNDEGGTEDTRTFDLQDSDGARCPAALSRRLLRPSRIARTTIHRSKAVGEPPLMLALSAFPGAARRCRRRRAGSSVAATRCARDRRANPCRRRRDPSTFMTKWIPGLDRARDDGQRAVIVTVAHTSGSAPREAGTAMVVTATDFHGTIGGGHLENEALETGSRRACQRAHAGLDVDRALPAGCASRAMLRGRGHAGVHLPLPPTRPRGSTARWPASARRHLLPWSRGSAARTTSRPGFW